LTGMVTDSAPLIN